MVDGWDMGDAMERYGRDKKVLDPSIGQGSQRRLPVQVLALFSITAVDAPVFRAGHFAYPGQAPSVDPPASSTWCDWEQDIIHPSFTR